MSKRAKKDCGIVAVNADGKSITLTKKMIEHLKLQVGDVVGMEVLDDGKTLVLSNLAIEAKDNDGHHPLRPLIKILWDVMREIEVLQQEPIRSDITLAEYEDIYFGVEDIQQKVYDLARRLGYINTSEEEMK